MGRLGARYRYLPSEVRQELPAYALLMDNSLRGSVTTDFQATVRGGLAHPGTRLVDLFYLLH